MSMKALGRWAPLVGGAILAASVTLKMVGQAELADTVLNLGGLFGLTTQSPVPVGELAAAASLVWGIVRKFKAVLVK